MTFERNIKNYGLDFEVKVSDIIKIFLNANTDIAAIPGTECLWFYYDGKPIGSVKNGQWKKFSSSYNDAVREKGLTEDFFKKQHDRRDYYLNPSLVEIIKDAFDDKFKNQKERKSQQVIVLNHQSFEPDKFSICGMETTIPEKDLERTTRRNGKQVEIDMVAICPAKQEILLIEYKCTKAATTGDITKSLETWDVKDENKKDVNKNIAEHFKDYLAIMEACKNEQFVCQIINAYNCLASLRGKETKIILEDKEDVDNYINKMKIVFLFTDRKDDKSTKVELTKGLYKNVIEYITKLEINYKYRLEGIYKDEYDKIKGFIDNFDNTLYYIASKPKEVNLNDESNDENKFVDLHKLKEHIDKKA